MRNESNPKCGPAPLPTKAALALVLALIMLLIQTLLHAGAGNTFAAGADQSNQLILFEPDAIEILVSFEHRGPHLEGVGPQFTFNPISNLLYLRFHPHDNHVTDISLSTGEIRYRDFTELPSFVNQMQVHPATDELYFWDDSIGRVFVLPPNDTLRRIDNSFKHRNQYGHTGWLDNQGRIHAFGGYGLFSFKSIITRFSPATGEWFLLQVEDETDMPAPQFSAVVVPDLARQEAYIFGMNRLQRDVPRYLRFESTPIEWCLEVSYCPESLELSGNPALRVGPPPAGNSKHASRRRLHAASGVDFRVPTGCNSLVS
jgi:hypothetical protein